MPCSQRKSSDHNILVHMVSMYTIGPNNVLDIADLNVVKAHCDVNERVQFQLMKANTAEMS